MPGVTLRNGGMRERNVVKADPSLEDTRPSRRRTGNPADDVDRLQLDALLRQARTARDSDQALQYLERAVAMVPDDPRVQSTVQLSLFDRLSSDAFLAYLAETDKRYVIAFRNARTFTVPKARNEPEQYPPARRTEAERAMRMMWWMILGLIPAGLVTIVLSPLAIGHGIRALQREGRNPQQHRMAWAAILIALGLGMLGVFFAALLLLHVLLVG